MPPMLPMAAMPSMPWTRMMPSRFMSPRATFRIRTPYRVRTLSPERLRIEKEQKAKADSLKKVPRR
jgi:hypothetical protein